MHAYRPGKAFPRKRHTILAWRKMRQWLVVNGQSYQQSHWEKVMYKKIQRWILLGIGIFTVSCSAPQESDSAVAALQSQIEALEHRLAVQEDVEQIRALQYAYNYYNSSRLYVQVLDLISEDAGSIEIGGRGIFHGKAGFARNFNPEPDGSVVDRGVEFGFILHQLAGMEVITVAPDRRTAQARVRVLTTIYDGYPQTRPRTNGGDYEMQFQREAGKWLISGLKYVHNFSVQEEPDGTVTPSYSRSGDATADAPTSWYHPWPETGVLAFHFPNPVTGEFPPDVTGTTRFWRGNWSPAEFGESGIRPAVEWQEQ